MLQSHQNVKWWTTSHSKLTRNSVALMFAHISTDNREFTADYISHLMDMVANSETIYIRHCERPLLRIVQVGDKIQPERIKRVQQKLLELFKGSVSCYMQADAITEIALKLSLRSPMFAQCLLKQHGELCKLLERYAKENPTLPICASKIRIFKEGQMRWNEIKPSFLNK